MARSRRPSRSRGGRRGEDAAPQPASLVGTQEMVPLDFTEHERPSRTSRGRASGGGGGGGAGIALVIPLIVTLMAAIALVVGGFIVAGGAKSGMNQVMDEVGVNTALALSVIEPEWWESTHGGTVTLYQLWQANYNKLQQKNRDDEVEREFLKGKYNEATEYWKIEEPSQTDMDRDRQTMDANRKRLQNLASISNNSVIYAGIFRPGGSKSYCYSGTWPSIATGRSIQIGEVKVTRVRVDGMGEGRLYEVSAKDRYGQKAAEVKVILSAGSLSRAAGGITTGVLISALVGILLVGAVSFLLCMGASKGIQKITQNLEQVSRGDLDVRIAARGGGEIGALGKAADRAMKTFRAVQEQSFAAAAAQPVAAADTTIDASSLLPSEPPRLDGYEIESVHKTCPEQANDFFDYIEVDENHVGLIIADMPHPGPRGAFIASTFRALMRAFGQGETSPAVVLGRVNRIMAGELKRGDHITAMYTVLDKANGILAVASAGHLPLIFWKLAKKGSALLNPEGIAIGLDKGPVFEKTVVDKRIKLEKGDRVVMHTDGPLSARNMEDEEYGEQRFYYLVNREAPKNSAAFVNFVANEVDLFHEGAMQGDDITIVTLRKLS